MLIKTSIRHIQYKLNEDSNRKVVTAHSITQTLHKGKNDEKVIVHTVHCVDVSELKLHGRCPSFQLEISS